MRYVIKHPSGGFFTEHAITGTVKSVEQDGASNDFVHKRPTLSPKFDAHVPQQAIKFDSEQDASDQMAHPHLEDAKAFDGCTVEPVAA